MAAFFNPLEDIIKEFEACMTNLDRELVTAALEGITNCFALLVAGLTSGRQLRHWRLASRLITVIVSALGVSLQLHAEQGQVLYRSLRASIKTHLSSPFA